MLLDYMVIQDKFEYLYLKNEKAVHWKGLKFIPMFSKNFLIRDLHRVDKLSERIDVRGRWWANSIQPGEVIKPTSHHR